MLYVFDILCINGEVLANRPLRERRSKLADVFTAVKGRLVMSDISEKSTKFVELHNFIDLRSKKKLFIILSCSFISSFLDNSRRFF